MLEPSKSINKLEVELESAWAGIAVVVMLKEASVRKSALSSVEPSRGKLV